MTSVTPPLNVTDVCKVCATGAPAFEYYTVMAGQTLTTNALIGKKNSVMAYFIPLKSALKLSNKIAEGVTGPASNDTVRPTAATLTSSQSSVISSYLGVSSDKLDILLADGDIRFENGVVASEKAIVFMVFPRGFVSGSEPSPKPSLNKTAYFAAGAIVAVLVVAMGALFMIRHKQQQQQLQQPFTAQTSSNENRIRDNSMSAAQND
jgi:hypothetical protein